MKIERIQQIPATTLYWLLSAISIAYVAHLFTSPFWLTALAFLVIVYQVSAHYYALGQINRWLRLALVILALMLLHWQYGGFRSSNFFISFLLTFIWLKTLETVAMRDLKALALANFYVIFAALLTVQELWILPYLIIALTANLALLIKIHAPEARLSQLGRRSLIQILVAIPFTLILFYLFPRLSNPLWQVPAVQQGQIGFADSLSPGTLSTLANNSSTVMRITYYRPVDPNPYWRGIVLSQFNGISWQPRFYEGVRFEPLAYLKPKQRPDYQILLEPHHKKWLFYQFEPVSSDQDLVFSSALGLARKNFTAIDQSFLYSLVDNPESYRPLSTFMRRLNTQLPQRADPDLQAWAKEAFAKVNHNPALFIQFLKKYIHDNPYYYTLKPLPIGNDRNNLDRFWFKTKSGFCEHYASAAAVILRAAGIPARVIIGYQSGRWNPVGEFLLVQQNDAHAWVEYWQEGMGWQRFDPTAAIAESRIDQAIKDLYAYRDSQKDLSWLLGGKLSFWTRLGLYWDSSHYFWERWLLFYNQEAQQSLLASLGLADWDWVKLLQVSIVLLVLFILLTGLWYRYYVQRSRDPLAKAYQRLKLQLNLMGISTEGSSSFYALLNQLSLLRPEYKPEVDAVLQQYEQIRLREQDSFNPEKQRQTRLLINRLCSALQKNQVA